ncbi:MAG TPA: helicase C-terminal domain-containing protein [Jatrophihabitantaceae bacterium]|jgi:hypothetical protein
MASSLAAWLATQSREELAGILSRRADVLRGPEPRDPSELAARLQHTGSVFDALTSLRLPALQAVEALLTLGHDPTRTQLAELLDPAGDPDHDANVDATLTELRRNALVWPSGGSGLRFTGALRDAFPDPLGLGPPARTLLSARTVADLHKMQTTLGLPRGGNKRVAVDSIVERLSDARFVRERVAELPASAREQLERLAGSGDADDEFDLHVYTARHQAERLLVERGLLIAATWGPQTSLPAEVARALRGDQFRAPFTPRRPAIEWDDVGVEAIEAEAGVRAADFAEHASTVLDLVAAGPVACLKSGGIGARELARLGKVTGTSDEVIRLIIELAAAAGLLDASGRLDATSAQVMVTAAYDAWRENDPAQRLAPLLATWWQLAATPTSSRDQDAKVIPALARRLPCQLCCAGRHALVAAVADAREGQGARVVDNVVRAAWWSCPSVHLTRNTDAGPPLAWAEAEALGVIARGALTRVGRALLADDAGRLDAALGQLLPESTQTATFGSDLTVVVSGAPAAGVRAVLDASADREGRGGATVWRFTPASVRRALDSGIAADDLERDLADIAATGLPQPLRYLIGDVARRHGHLRVSAGACCVVSPDEALLAEVVGHRKLRALKLRLVAPTVAIGRSSVGATVSALRAAGYLPLAEGPDGAVALDRPGNARAAPPRVTPASPSRSRPNPQADPATVAARLLAARPSLEPDVDLPPDVGLPSAFAMSLTEALIGEFAADLDYVAIRQLAHAVDENLPVRIEYEAATGGYTSRVVSELQVQPPFLVGWCHLRDAERMFTLARIQSATAV